MMWTWMNRYNLFDLAGDTGGSMAPSQAAPRTQPKASTILKAHAKAPQATPQGTMPSPKKVTAPLQSLRRGPPLKDQEMIVSPEKSTTKRVEKAPPIPAEKGVAGQTPIKSPVMKRVKPTDSHVPPGVAACRQYWLIRFTYIAS